MCGNKYCQKIEYDAVRPNYVSSDDLRHKSLIAGQAQTITAGTLRSAVPRSHAECRCYTLLCRDHQQRPCRERGYRQCFRPAGGAAVSEKKKGRVRACPRRRYAKGEKKNAGSVVKTCRRSSGAGYVPESTMPREKRKMPAVSSRPVGVIM